MRQSDKIKDGQRNQSPALIAHSAVGEGDHFFRRRVKFMVYQDRRGKRKGMVYQFPERKCKELVYQSVKIK